MNDSVLVSVIIPTHNRAALLRRAIQSVLSQTFTEFELIVVDDASTDNTPEVLAHYSDPRMRYVRQEANLGGGAARNAGIAMAQGEFVAFLDSDDEWASSKLSAQLSQVRCTSGEHGLFYCSYYRNIEGVMVRRDAKYYEGRVRHKLLAGWAPTMMSSCLIRRSLLLAEPFDESLKGFQDFDLWLRLSAITSFKFLPEPLVVLHEHRGDRLSTNPEKRGDALLRLEKKWRERLEGNDLRDFEALLRRFHTQLVAKDLWARARVQSCSRSIWMLVKSLDKQVEARELLKLLLFSLVGPSRYQSLRARHLKRKGLARGPT